MMEFSIERDILEASHQLTKLVFGHDQNFADSVNAYRSSKEGEFHKKDCFKRYELSPSIFLPEPKLISTPLSKVLRNRRTATSFSHRKSSIQNVSDTLFNGLLSDALSVQKQKLPRQRPYPAAGAIYTAEHYVILNNVDGLGKSVCHFSPTERKLSVINEEFDYKAFPKVTNCSVDELDDIGFVVIQTILPKRAATKYLERGYLFSMLEAGMALQNILLVSSAINLPARLWGNYYDDEVGKIIGIDNVDENVSGMIMIGAGGG
jgi:SagB-type dehydrogenase family enzyme